MSNSERADYTYSYRLDGNQIQKTDSENGTTEYVYDPLGQLKSETTVKEGESRSISYDYDSRGNRISRNNGGIISQYTYDSSNRLLEESSVNGGTESRVRYSYDNNGNLIFKGTELYTEAEGQEEEISLGISGSGTAEGKIAEAMAVHYTYNDRGYLTNVKTDNGLDASYTYDVSERRRSKTVNGVTTNHIWDGQNIVRETGETGEEIAKYYRGSRLIAQKAGTAVSYYTYDAHGNVVAMNGQSYEYDAFGNILENNVTVSNPFRYNGEYYDEETEMIYLRARYYDSAIGRFISEDPAKDGLNWYVFCSNDPVMFVDPWGLDDYLVVLASGINSNRSDDAWKAMKNEIQYRFNESGDNVEFLEVFPYGEVYGNEAIRDQLAVVQQASEVLTDSSTWTSKGGKDINYTLTNYQVKGNQKIILIGHSGGGVAVIDAYKSMSEKTKAQVSQVVAIGSPKTVVTDGQWKTTYIGDPNDSITYTDPLGFSPGEQYAPDYYYEIDNGVHVPEVTGITEVGEYIRTSLFEVHTSYFNTYEKAAKILDKFWDRI